MPEASVLVVPALISDEEKIVARAPRPPEPAVEADLPRQATALGDQAGATAAIRVQLRTIQSAVKSLDAIYNNVYSGDAETLGKWKTQSLVEKVPKKKKPPTPTPPPGP